MSLSMKALPNLLSGTRVALVPVLWILALRGEAVAVGVGLVAAGLTDVLDGPLARRSNAASARGAALDSLGDNLLAPSGAAWLVLLRPDVASRFAIPLVTWVALYACFIAVGLLKFRRFGNLHLYSSKAAAALAYMFFTYCLLFAGVPVALGWLAFGLSVLSVLEGLACQIVCQEIDEHVGSLVRVLWTRRARFGAGRPSARGARRPNAQVARRPNAQVGVRRAT